MMHLNVTGNVESIIQEIDGLRSRSIPYAVSQAINDTLFDMRKAFSDEEKAVFDKPTVFTTNLNAWDIDRATPQYAIGTISAKPAQDDYLIWQVDGGIRNAKKKAIGIPLERSDILAWHGGLTVGWKKVFADKKRYFSGIPKNHPSWAPGVYKRVKNGKVPGLKRELSWKTSVKYTKNPFNMAVVAENFVNANFNEKFARRLVQAMEYQLRK